MTATFDENAFSGLLHAGTHGTFMRLPSMPAKAADLKEAGITAAVLGVPWDAMCISRTGANYGPRTIRDVSDQFSFFNANTGVDLNDHYKMADCGDVPVNPGAAVQTIDRAEAMVTEILEGGAMPVTIGGDHSITISCVRAFAKKYKKPGLVLVDMHFDTAEALNGETLSHCCPITRAVDAGFDPSRIAIVGTGGWMNPKSELNYIKDKGITVFPAEQIWEEGARSVARKAAAVANNGADGVYITYDIDAIDAAYAPGTGVPAPGGMTSREAIAMANELGRIGIHGCDLVEVSPSWDHDGITSRLAVRLILEMLAGNAEANR
ncbi:agmatinase [Microbaculum marinisediminis]|uniref:Agmatinase n=1 Tax=Microbaculum marinisediminis TaxID=2931392 RepID=A0AAW5R075_9HYPH|nr:agmatinase [Microbaculum sp. A6E488]MCT8972715.1 agmatinase [Microbaculum sp. A6E488]